MSDTTSNKKSSSILRQVAFICSQEESLVMITALADRINALIEEMKKAEQKGNKELKGFMCREAQEAEQLQRRMCIMSAPTKPRTPAKTLTITEQAYNITLATLEKARLEVVRKMTESVKTKDGKRLDLQELDLRELTSALSELIFAAQ